MTRNTVMLSKEEFRRYVTDICNCLIEAWTDFDLDRERTCWDDLIWTSIEMLCALMRDKSDLITGPSTLESAICNEWEVLDAESIDELYDQIVGFKKYGRRGVPDDEDPLIT